jgi:hypothetical protein
MTELTAALGTDAVTALIDGEVTAGACYAIDSEVIRVQGPDVSADYWPGRRVAGSWLLERAVGGTAAEHAEGAELTAVVPIWGTGPLSDGSSVDLTNAHAASIGLTSDSGDIVLNSAADIVLNSASGVTIDGGVSIDIDAATNGEFAIADADGNTIVYVVATGGVVLEPPPGSPDTPLTVRDESGAYLLVVGPAVQMFPAAIFMPNLPMDDPEIAGQLWNDSGTLKVSAGPPP